MVHKFEIFSAGCKLCKNAVEILKNALSEKDEVIEYNLKDSIDVEIQEKIKQYDIKAVPSIIINEKHKITGIPDPEEINKLIGKK